MSRRRIAPAIRPRSCVTAHAGSKDDEYLIKSDSLPYRSLEKAKERKDADNKARALCVDIKRRRTTEYDYTMAVL